MRARSVCSAAVCIAIATTASLRAANYSVEFIGNNFNLGNSATFPVTVAATSEFMLSTYSYSGGALPSGTYSTVGGGMDGKIELLQSSTVIGVHDDLSGTNRDAELRSYGYAGPVRAVASLVSALAPATYDVRLTRFLGGNADWSLAFASNGPGLSVGMPSLGGATIFITNLYGSDGPGGQLHVSSGTFATYSLQNVSGNAVFDGNATLNVGSQYLGSDRGSLSILGNANFVAQIAAIGSSTLADSKALFNTGGTIDISTNLLVGFNNSATGTVDQFNGTVTTPGVYIGSPAYTLEAGLYRLSGGTLNTNALVIDSTSNNLFLLSGGKVSLPSPAALSGSVGAGFTWTAGTLQFTSPGAVIDLRKTFDDAGPVVSAGKTLDIGSASGSTAPITLAGGRLIANGLSAPAPLNWLAGTLDLSGAGTITTGANTLLGATPRLDAGRSLVASTVFNPATSIFTIGAAGSVSASIAFNNASTLQFDGVDAILLGTLNSTGLVSGTGIVQGTFNNNIGGRLFVNAGKSFFVDGTLNNSGDVRLDDGTLRVTGTLTNAAGKTISGRGFLTANALSNSGAITFSGGTSDLDAPLTVEAGGKVLVTGAGDLTVYKNVTLNPGSEMRVSADASATFLGNVSGLSRITGSGTKYFEAGASDGALMTGTGSSVVELPATLTSAGIREKSLTIRGSMQLTASSPTSTLAELVFDGGILDLTNNLLALNYDGASPYAAMRAAVLAGTLNSSVLPSTGRAVGVVDNGVFGALTFGGIAVDGTSLLVRFTLKGDCNLDGTVNFDDLLALAQNYNGGAKTWSQGDSNYDGAVNFDDLLSLAQNYNQSMTIDVSALGSDFAADWALARALVPEPTALLGLACLLPRRRR